MCVAGSVKRMEQALASRCNRRKTKKSSAGDRNVVTVPEGDRLGPVGGSWLSRGLKELHYGREIEMPHRSRQSQQANQQNGS